MSSSVLSRTFCWHSATLYFPHEFAGVVAVLIQSDLVFLVWSSLEVDPSPFTNSMLFPSAAMRNTVDKRVFFTSSLLYASTTYWRPSGRYSEMPLAVTTATEQNAPSTPGNLPHSAGPWCNRRMSMIPATQFSELATYHLRASQTFASSRSGTQYSATTTRALSAPPPSTPPYSIPRIATHRSCKSAFSMPHVQIQFIISDISIMSNGAIDLDEIISASLKKAL